MPIVRRSIHAGLIQFCNSDQGLSLGLITHIASVVQRLKKTHKTLDFLWRLENCGEKKTEEIKKIPMVSMEIQSVYA